MMMQLNKFYPDEEHLHQNTILCPEYVENSSSIDPRPVRLGTFT